MYLVDLCTRMRPDDDDGGGDDVDVVADADGFGHRCRRIRFHLGDGDGLLRQQNLSKEVENVYANDYNPYCKYKKGDSEFVFKFYKDNINFSTCSAYRSYNGQKLLCI